jgi:hypothetical protein
MARPGADQFPMGRGVIGMCAVFGSTVGGYLPTLWGASSLGMQSLLVGLLGGIAGVWLGVRISDV